MNEKRSYMKLPAKWNDELDTICAGGPPPFHHTERMHGFQQCKHWFQRNRQSQLRVWVSVLSQRMNESFSFSLAKSRGCTQSGFVSHFFDQTALEPKAFTQNRFSIQQFLWPTILLSNFISIDFALVKNQFRQRTVTFRKLTLISNTSHKLDTSPSYMKLITHNEFFYIY